MRCPCRFLLRERSGHSLDESTDGVRDILPLAVVAMQKIIESYLNGESRA